MSETDTDIDEPPTKMSKLQGEKSIEEQHPEPEEEDDMGEGQEEWLSEGILTDDDYNPGAEQDTVDPSLAGTCENSQMSQDNETPSLEDSVEQQTVAEDKSWAAQMENGEVGKELIDATLGTTDGIEGHSVPGEHQKSSGDREPSVSTVNSDMRNIEEALNSFEAKPELTDVLETFLIRKPGVKLEEREANKDTQAADQQNDDGNDTDELLRLLGDDDNKLKKKVLVKKSNRKDVQTEDSSDDEFTYERAASVKTLRVARNVLMKGRPASKAVPEDMSDGGNYAASSDEASTVKKMFGVPVKKRPTATTNTVKPVTDQTKSLVKHVVHISKTSDTSSSPIPAPVKQYGSKSASVLPNVASKPATRVEGRLAALKSEMNQRTQPVREIGSRHVDDRRYVSRTDAKLEPPEPLSRIETQEKEEIIDEEEFLEEDEDFDLDEEEFAEESETEDGSRRQRIMRPERMDEEIPSDAESHTEDGSLYDEIPSSDSEDLDDWFTLDIRTERAGDYLPLLGPKARELMLEEKRRVSTRLATLRQSLSALTESGRKQAEQLRHATMSLAELDDMLKAT